MPLSAEVSIPSLVRVKPGAVRRAGLYLRRAGLVRVALMQSEGLPAALLTPLEQGLHDATISVLQRVEIHEASFEAASASLLDDADFFATVRADPFDPQEWLAAIAAAPTMKADHYTVLSSGDRLPEVRALIDPDPRLQGCFQR